MAWITLIGLNTAHILTFAQARQMVEEHARVACASEPELVPLLTAVGRVLAQDVVADRDMPPFPRATRDGFAVRAAEVAAAPGRLQIAGEIRAGAEPELTGRTLRHGEAIAIMTGAPLPPGADAVVMVEYTAAGGGSVEIACAVKA